VPIQHAQLTSQLVHLVSQLPQDARRIMQAMFGAEAQ